MLHYTSNGPTQKTMTVTIKCPESRHEVEALLTAHCMLRKRGATRDTAIALTGVRNAHIHHTDGRYSAQVPMSVRKTFMICRVLSLLSLNLISELSHFSRHVLAAHRFCFQLKIQKIRALGRRPRDL